MDKPTILIVDDHAINRALPAVILRDAGFATDEAASGSDALEKLGKGTYAAVLLDISMPDMSGEDVCRQIRNNARLFRLPVIAYTAHAMSDSQSEIMAAGFNSILIKPISRRMLLDCIGLHGAGANPSETA